MAQTYIAWRRHTLLSAIDALPASEDEAAPPHYAGLLRQLNHSLPTPQISATLDDLLQAQSHLCTPRQLATMRAFRAHLPQLEAEV